MKIKTFKRAALLLAAGAVITPAISYAANDPITVNSSITTLAAIDTVDGDDMDFGSWFIVLHGGDTPTITMDTAGDILVAGNTNSQVQNLAGAPVGTAGSLTVDVPLGVTNAVLQMTHAGITQPTDTNVTLTGITYSDGTVTDQDFTAGTAVDVVVQAGGTPQDVTFGGEFTFAATPTDDTHVASFIVSFAY